MIGYILHGDIKKNFGRGAKIFTDKHGEERQLVSISRFCIFFQTV